MKNKIDYKKILAGVSLALACSTGLVAQTTSYYLNNAPITGANCSAFGQNALLVNGTGSYNEASGINALRNNTSGTYNSSNGANSLFANTTGNQNTATGVSALGANTTANDNTANGAFCLRFSTGAQNTAAGAWAMTNNTSGLQNVSMGTESMNNSTTGSYNAIIGFRALYSNTSGGSNSVLGFQSMYNNTTGYNNTAMGYSSLINNQTGANNTSIGLQSLYNTNANNNTGLGYQALYNNTSGTGNTGVGLSADVNAGNLTNATAVGNGAVVNLSNRVWLGNANLSLGNVWSYGTYNTMSDGRFKTNISETDVKGIEFIKLLRPVVYNFEAKKATEYMTKNMSDEARKAYLSEDYTKATEVRQSGFIAQEVAEAAKKSGYNFNGVHTPVDNNDAYGIAYGQLVVPLVKAVQEQQQMIEAQKAANEAMQKQLAAQQELINSLVNKTGSATGINDVNTTGVNGFSMGQNEPNPFTHETVVNYNIPQSVNAAYMAVYDLSGKQVTTFAIDQKGASAMTISSEKLAAGIYIYSIVADGKVMDSKKMIVAGK